jgi:hypothetical protein
MLQEGGGVKVICSEEYRTMKWKVVLVGHVKDQMVLGMKGTMLHCIDIVNDDMLIIKCSVIYVVII